MSKIPTATRSQAWTNEFGPVCCGKVVAFDGDWRPLVHFQGNTSEPIVARWLHSVCLDKRLLEGATVLLAFDHGDPNQPIIVGIVESDSRAFANSHEPSVKADTSIQAVVDGRKVVIKGDEEVTLVCGKASITLTKDGRINLLGVEIMSRASGSNKIRGASVNIN